MFPHTVTLYNKFIDNGVEKWQRIILPGVLWNGLKSALMRKTGLTSADAVTVFIPKSISVTKTYLKPKEFAASENKSNHWTIQPGDSILLGTITTEIVKSASELKSIDDVYTVTNVDLRDFGDDMAHWEVTGK